MFERPCLRKWSVSFLIDFNVCFNKISTLLKIKTPIKYKLWGALAKRFESAPN